MGFALAIATVAGVLTYGQAANAAVRYHDPASASEQSYIDSQSGPFPERELPDGTFTGPIDHSANGG
jgi:hypothetical protein